MIQRAGTKVETAREASGVFSSEEKTLRPLFRAKNRPKVHVLKVPARPIN